MCACESVCACVCTCVCVCACVCVHILFYIYINMCMCTSLHIATHHENLYLLTQTLTLFEILLIIYGNISDIFKLKSFNNAFSFFSSQILMNVI